MKIVVAVLFLTSLSYGKCNLAVLLHGNSPKYEMGNKLATKLDGILKTVDKRNRAYQIYSPLATSKADYLYVITPDSRNTAVRVGQLAPNRDLYSNTYSNRSFFSADQILSTLAGDFKSQVLPQLKWCLKK